MNSKEAKRIIDMAECGCTWELYPGGNKTEMKCFECKMLDNPEECKHPSSIKYLKLKAGGKGCSE